MQHAVRPTAVSVAANPMPSNASRLTMLYSELQEQLAELVRNSGPYPYPDAIMIRHALEGSIKLQDALILAQQIEEQQPKKILEIGSFIGFSTRWLLESTHALGSTIVSVDPGIRHRVFDRPGDVLRQFNAEFLRTRLLARCGFFAAPIGGDCYYDYEHYEPRLSRPEVDKILQDRPLLHSGNLDEGSFDLIFIDGDHTAGAVLGNFTEALALLNPAGRIAFHDAITWPEVTRTLEHIAQKHADIGSVEILGRLPGPPSTPGSCDGVAVFHLH